MKKIKTLIKCGADPPVRAKASVVQTFFYKKIPVQGLKSLSCAGFGLMLCALMAACSRPHPPSKPPAIAFVTKTLPRGLTGISYYQLLVVSGAQSPVGFSIIAGTLCDGLKLQPAEGLISGVPTKAETCGFTVKVMDSRGGVALQNLGINVQENGPIVR